jgi:uncharacterized membrane protein YoaT (DUF817 family)
MDLQSLINYVTMTAAAATVIGVQILKSPLIPVRFQNYPVATAAVVSAIATYFALATQHFVWALGNWTQIVGTFVTVLLVSALTYNHVVQKSPAIKSLEAPAEGSVPAK